MIGFLNTASCSVQKLPPSTRTLLPHGKTFPVGPMDHVSPGTPILRTLPPKNLPEHNLLWETHCLADKKSKQQQHLCNYETSNVGLVRLFVPLATGLAHETGSWIKDSQGWKY